MTAGDAWLRAAVAYHFGKFVWVLDAGPRAARWPTWRSRRCTRRTARSTRRPSGSRRRSTTASVVGNLRRPAHAERPPLVLIVIAGLDSTKEEFFTLEEVFLRRGMATLSLDGPGQGESGYELPIRHDYEVAVAAVLDILDGREDLDLERVGALGVSLGGYYAPRAAAFEPRIRAVAGISGPFNFGALWDRLPELTRETFTHKSGARERRRGARAGAGARPRRRARAARPPGAVRHRQARPADPVGVDRAAGAGGAAGRVRRARGGQPRVRERAVPCRARWWPTGCASASDDRASRSSARGCGRRGWWPRPAARGSTW